MANRRSFQTLTQQLYKATLHPKPSLSLQHLRTLSQMPNFPQKSLHPTSRETFLTPNLDSSSTHFRTYRHFSSDQHDNSDNDDESEEDDSDYDDDDIGNDAGNSVLKREYSPEEREIEAAAIGYKVIGQLQRSDRVFNPYEPVFAVIQIGAHQFKVSNGDCIYTEKLKFCEVNDKLILNKVLMLGSKTQTMIGRPVLPEAAVHAVVEEHALDAKVIIFKKKRRKNYRRKKGHRQELTKLRITDIQGIEKPEMPTSAKTEKAAAKKVEKAAVAA
ncbi:50S ribosomal protein L21, mitochondrial [Cynara cardunculus var. scolymus]|uniref:50S ribosomal protein L21, mitochondrial n=1 Tax=Cynara cardunculus var. scolymus TaxID=59895 RepID=UPI000D631535|nr:50S ribosomal protein L21, mitochondrial [Cynara cardunculus var. scolymus]